MVATDTEHTHHTGSIAEKARGAEFLPWAAPHLSVFLSLAHTMASS